MNKYILIAVAVISFSVGWFIKDNIADARIAEINLDTAETLKSIAVTAATKQQELQNELDVEQRKWAAVESEQYAIMQNAKDETRRLDAAVNALNKRLLVNASCPASSDNMPETGTDSRVGERARPELNPDARPTYNALRDGIVTLEAQMAYLRERCN